MFTGTVGGQEVASMFVKVTADAGQFHREMAEVDKDLDKTAGKAKAHSSRISQFASKMAAPAAVAVGALALAGRASVKAASDQQESLSKTKVLFGQYAKVIPGYSKSVASAFGMSRTAALDASASIGAMLIPMGKTPGEAAKMSKRMLELGRDMASFHNQDPTDMMDRLRAGLAGESEPLRRFGINLSDAAVKAYAYKQGIAAAGAELTDSQKLTARYGLAIQQAGVANGDFARTADGLANKQRIMGAQIDDLSAKFGKALLPAAAAVVGIISALTGWFSRNTGVAQILAGVVLTLGTAILGIVAYVKTAAAVQWLWNAALNANPIGITVVAIAALAAGLIYAYKHSEAFRKVVNGMTDALKGVIDWVKGNWQTIATVISGPFAPLVILATDAFGIRSKLIAALTGAKALAGTAAEFVAGAIKTALMAPINFAGWLKDKVVDPVRDIAGQMASAGAHVGTAFANGIRDAIVNAMKGIYNAVGFPVNRIIGAINSIPIVPDIDWSWPKYAKGGTVSRPTLALIGESGPEVVVPVGPGKRKQGEHWLRVAGNLLGGLKGNIPAFADGGYINPRTAVVDPAGIVRGDISMGASTYDWPQAAPLSSGITGTGVATHGWNPTTNWPRNRAWGRSWWSRWTRGRVKLPWWTGRRWGRLGGGRSLGGPEAFADGGSSMPGLTRALGTTLTNDQADAYVRRWLTGANEGGTWDKLKGWIGNGLSGALGMIPRPGEGLAGGFAQIPYQAARGYVERLFSRADRFNIPQIDSARSWARGVMGRPYVWGGGHGGWNYDLPGYDCSGFASHAAKRAGAAMAAPGTTSSTFASAQRGRIGPVEWGWRGMGGGPRGEHMGAKILGSWYQFGNPGHSGGTDAQWSTTGVPPGLPTLAGGGYVMRTGAAVVHRGETVGRAGPINITVMPGTGITRAQARMLARELQPELDRQVRITGARV